MRVGSSVRAGRSPSPLICYKQHALLLVLWQLQTVYLSYRYKPLERDREREREREKARDVSGFLQAKAVVALP